MAKKRARRARQTRRPTVCVAGIWHLGAVNAVGFAEKGYSVVGLEFDPARCAALNRGVPPLFEPGLKELMATHLATGRLRFESDPSCVASADWVVIAYDTPVNDRDEIDISPIVDAANRMAVHLSSTTPLIITSQLPLGTSETIEASVREINRSWEGGVVYNPENLRLGTAITRFLNPDMLVLGSNHFGALKTTEQLYRPFRTHKLTMDLRSAEMVKHSINAFLATSIAFINEIAGLCDRLGADAVAVGNALRLDERIGRRALMSPGLGFSGGTLARDVTQLRTFAQTLGHRSRLFESVMDVNEGTFDEILIKLRMKLGTLKSKRIGILGLTYKAGTSTVRRSPAIKIIHKLKEAKARCFAYDPMASSEELGELRGQFTRVDKVEPLFKGADGIVLVTEWPEFKALPYERLAASMRVPFLIDSKNFLEPKVLTAAGLTYFGFGRRVKEV